MGIRSLVLGLLSIAPLTLARADDTTRDISVSLKSESGETYTLQLAVPTTGGGPCELTALLPALPEEPMPVPPIIDPPRSSVHFGMPYPYASSRVYPPDTRPPSSLSRLLRSGVKFKELGTLTTQDRAAHENCRLISTEDDGVIVLDDEGFSKILFSDLDAGSRQKVTFSPAPILVPPPAASPAVFLRPPIATTTKPPVAAPDGDALAGL